MTRRMMQMVDTINQTNFGGRQVVTCFTCHRGTSRPSVMPSIDLCGSSPPPFEPGDPIAPARGQPSADALLDKHITALGGAARLEQLKGFTAKGRYLVRRCREEPDGAVCRCAGASNCCQPHCVG